jgi:hypothetical protein
MGPRYKARLVGLLRDVVTLYKASGRGHAELSDRKLDRAFLAAFRAYAKDCHDRGLCRSLNDIAAEYILRDRSQERAIEEIVKELNPYFLHAYIDDVVSNPPVVLFAFGWILWVPALGRTVVLTPTTDTP